MTDVAIQRTASKLLYRGRVAQLSLDFYRTADGKTFRKETIRHPASVVILPILPKNRVLLIHQFRHALGRYIYEIPAGTRSPNESLLACAKRELAEEAVYRANRWERLTQFYPAPGISTERMVLYRASNLTPLSRLVAKDPDEYITPRIVTAPQAVEMVYKGQIMDAKSIIGILWGLHRVQW